MSGERNFRKTAKISLVLVYLVIVAGAIVRMTGSGMGCPDWPKCFGYYIPPTAESELKWQPEKNYSKGQVIIIDKALHVASNDFDTALVYDQNNWKPYTKHAYAVYNPWHTWIEFINRLFGAVAGLATLLLALISIRYWQTNKKLTILSWAIVLAMGFQGWLGATVVYSVLNPFKITLHMLMALIIVAMLLYVIASCGTKQKVFKYDNKIILLFTTALILTLIQVVLGTQVREFVDSQIALAGEHGKSLWLAHPRPPFYLHRSFSIVVTVLNMYIAYLIYKLDLGYSKINWVVLLIFFEIISGMAMYYLSFPFATQPVHLVVATILFGVQFYLILEALKSKRSHKTS